MADDQRTALVRAMVAEGTSDDDITAALKVYDAQHAASPKGQVAIGSTFGEKIQHAASMIGGAMPAAGGIIGGVLGGAPGAAVGGGVGYGYGQLLQHATEIPGAIADVSRDFLAHPVATAEGVVKGTNTGGLNVGAEAVTQAVGQKTGDALVAGGGVMSKWLMNRATSRVSAALMRDFPDLSDTLIDNALTVSKGGEGQARALLSTARAKVTQILRTADGSGATIPIDVGGVADSFKTALLEDAVKSGRITTQAGQPLTVASSRLDPATAALFKQIDAGGTMNITPSQAEILKRQLQRESKLLYANRVAQNGPKAMGMDATERADFATQLNDAIDAVAPGYKAANGDVQPLIGAVRGIHQAIRPNGNLLQAMVRPAVGAALGGAAGEREGGSWGGVAGAAAGAALTSPAGMSREAILLAHPAVQGTLRALPKPLAGWLYEKLAMPATPQAATGGSQ